MTKPIPASERETMIELLLQGEIGKENPRGRKFFEKMSDERLLEEWRK